MLQISRITLFASDIPYPPVHGGRVDLWRRIKFLASQKVQIQLICWSNEEILSEALEEIDLHYLHEKHQSQ